MHVGYASLFQNPFDALTDREVYQQELRMALMAEPLGFDSVPTLADLYDPLSMPPELVRAHQTLDRAVDAAYGKRSFASEAERVAFLFELYQAITSLLPAAPVKKKHKTVVGIKP